MVIRTVLRNSKLINIGRIFFDNKRTIITAAIVEKVILTTKKSYAPPYSHVCQIGDPVLRQRCTPIDPEAIRTPQFQKIVNHMHSIMQQYELLGLSAPQVGLPWRMFLIDQPLSNLDSSAENTTSKQGKSSLTVAINPVLTVTDYNRISDVESCASVVGYSGEVPRYEKISLEALSSSGEPFHFNANGWAARVIQHEYDHIDGKIYVDKMKPDTFSFVAWEMANRKEGKLTLRLKPTFKTRFLRLMNSDRESSTSVKN